MRKEIGEIAREKGTDLGEITTISSMPSWLCKSKVYFLLKLFYVKFLSCLEKAVINSTRSILVLVLAVPFPSCVTLVMSYRPPMP